MADSTYRSYSFSYGEALRIQYETELGVVTVALQESGGKFQKTFPQTTPDPPYLKGDTFTIGPELDNSNLFPGQTVFGPWTAEVEECTVSDQPLGSRDGRNLDRIWIVNVSGRIHKQGGTPNPLEGSPADVNHPVSYNYSEKLKDGKTTRSGSRSFWLPTPASPYDLGDSFSPIPGGTAIQVTDVSISEQVIGKQPGGSLKRLWKITVTGDEESSSGSTTVNYSFSRENAEQGYELVRGSMTKTSTSTSAPTMPAIGDTFAVPYIGNVKCTKVNGTQEAPPGDTPSWSITVEGATVIIPEDFAPEGDESVEYTPNGVVTRDVAGNMVVMLRSSTPKTAKSITVYNDSATRLTTLGQLYQGMIATSERIVKENIMVDGVKIAEFYQHEISTEY
jgi:hypothetical protein